MNQESLPYRLAILICLLIYPVCQLSGQSPEVPAIVNFSKVDYAGQKQNWQIDQMPNGLMVFANTAGLMTFDGVNWSLYEMPHQQIIRTLLVDQDRIYVGSYGEFGYWATNETGQLNYHSLIELIDRKLTDGEEIWNIFKIGPAVYFHSFGTVFKYDELCLIRILPPQSIRFMHPIDSQTYLLQVTGNGIMQFSADSFTHLYPQSSINDLKITGISPDGEHGLLLATEKNGLFKIERQQIILFPTEADKTLKIHQINKLLQLSSGLWAVGTISDGLLILDSQGSIKYHINKNGGLQNNTVLSLFEDAQHHLWVGLDDGIALIDLPGPSVYYLDNSGQIGTLYDAIEYNQQLFIGTNQGLFARSLLSKSLTNGFQLIEGTQGQVWDLQLIDGMLFCGHNNGTYTISNNRIKQISKVTGGWHLVPVKGRKDKLVQGTYTGLITLSREANGWSFGHSITGFNGVVKQLAFDDQGWLWVVNPYRGLHRLRIDFEQDSVLELQAFSPINGLPSDFNVSLLEFNNRLLFLSGQQYYSFDSEKNSFIPFQFPWPKELKFDKIITTDSDLYFLVRSGSIDVMTEDQHLGHIKLDLVQGSEKLVHLENNRYLACLENGYAIFNPWHNQPADPLLVQAAVSQFRAWDRSGKLRYDLNGSIDSIDQPVALSPKINRVEFHFASYDFTANQRFRYRLEGFDHEWSPWTLLHRKEYTNLLPGIYRFYLQYEGREPILAIEVIQDPAWHQTLVARVLFFILIIGLVYILYRYYDRRLKTQTRRIEIEKEREINRERLALQNELLEREIRHKSEELANSTMNIIQKNKVLLKLREQITEVRSGIGKQFPDKQYHQLIRLIQQHMSDRDNWKVFETNFNDVHATFFRSLKNDYPDLTYGDLKLAAYLKMNLTTKEIAPLLNISIRGVENKRYRLRLKMKLEHDENLLDILLRY